VRRGPVKTLGIIGWCAVILGALSAGAYTSDNAACGSSVGVIARGASQTAQNSCVFYGAAVTGGIVLVVVGCILLAGWVWLLVRGASMPNASRQQTRSGVPPSAGWYQIPGDPHGRMGYWTGSEWRLGPPDG
jgi:hypothetical protein